MRLVDLNPRWVGSGGPGISQQTDRPHQACAGAGCEECHQSGKEYEPAPARHGIGISFDCPCPVCTSKRTGGFDEDFYLRIFVSFANPLDGGPPIHGDRHLWQRTGDTFETLSLTPSILSVAGRDGCGWHGFVGSNGAQPGEVITV